MYQSIINTIKENNKPDSNRLSWLEYFMALSYLVSCRSPCHRLRVGCVLVKDNRVIATGYNGFIAGTEHVSIVEHGHEQNKVHAETNAILDCAKRGVSLDNCIAFVTHYPCYNCAKNLVTVGVNTVYYSEDYKNDPKVEYLFKQKNIKAIQF